MRALCKTSLCRYKNPRYGPRRICTDGSPRGVAWGDTKRRVWGYRMRLPGRQTMSSRRSNSEPSPIPSHPRYFILYARCGSSPIPVTDHILSPLSRPRSLPCPSCFVCAVPLFPLHHGRLFCFVVTCVCAVCAALHRIRRSGARYLSAYAPTRSIRYAPTRVCHGCGTDVAHAATLR
eukprot:3704460-Rhodomonas_salina.1